MTDIEQKALELVNAERLRRGWYECSLNDTKNFAPAYFEALCRALEAHELDKARHAAELREQAERFSEAAQAAMQCGLKLSAAAHLSPFILAPVDPLVEAVTEMLNLPMALTDEQAAHHLRDALEARGLAIVKKEAVNG